MRSIYNLLIYTYYIGIQIAALFNHAKAKKWLKGRKFWYKKLAESNPKKRKVAWFHVASLGEFEQARPLLEKYKESNKQSFILLTFFSPSGFEVRKDYTGADFICYLPLDTKKNAQKFFDLVDPEIAVFVKYEFWFNFLDVIIDRKIKTIMISGIFRKTQHFFKWYGRWFRKHLKAFSHFYLQDANSKKLLNNIGFSNITVVGDNRFDRVIEISKTPYTNSSIDSFCGTHPIIIYGSSWNKEQEFALQFSKDFGDWKLIIAPHEIIPERAVQLCDMFNAKSIVWSKVGKDQDISDYRVLIIDQIGMLSKLYRYASIAVIGGGFGKGIHNLLEAAVYGIPVIFGPNFQKFQEAKDLIEKKAGYSVKNYDEVKQLIHHLSDEENKERIKRYAKDYVIEKAGATDIIYRQLSSN